MTDEELDQWRGQEAWRLRHQYPEEATEVIAARLAREGRKPPAPVVDPDLLAFREWLANDHEANAWTGGSLLCRLGRYDDTEEARAFLAGARMAREQERERAGPLVRYIEDLGYSEYREAILAKYQGEA